MQIKKEKELLAKITPAVGLLLAKANAEWTDREISELSRVPTNRLTEYKNFKKYGRAITIGHIVGLIGGGFFHLEDIIKSAKGLTEEEERHLLGMNFYEDAELRKRIVKNRNRGVEPADLYRLIDELKDKGLDPIEILNKAKEESQ